MESSRIDPVLQTAAPARRVMVSEAVLLRLGALPFSSSEALTPAGTSAAIERSRWLEAARLAKAQDLSSLLHAAVGAVKDNGRLQHALLAIRRDTFNGRRPAGADLATATSHLDSAAQMALNEWCQLHDGLMNHNQAAEELLRHGIAQGRERLKRLLGEPSLRKGLLLSSRSFARTLDEYTRHKDQKLDRKMRRTERTLLSYLFRTTHKTSPFSTFTPVAFGRFTNETHDLSLPALDSHRVESVSKPNVGVLSRVAQALAQNALSFSHLRLTVNPGIAAKGDRLTYWKRNETAIHADGPVHTRVSEHFFWVHLTKSLELIVDSMQAAGALTIEEICALLSTSLGIAEPDAALYVRLLLENGLLLIAGARRSVFDQSTWDHFTNELLLTEDDAIRDIAHRLQNIEREAARFGLIDVDARVQSLEDLDAQVQSVFNLAGGTAPPLQPVLFEDARVSGKAVRIKDEIWQAPLSDLASLQRMFALFDPLLIPKVSLKALFKRKFRSTLVCKDILSFNDYFHESFYRPYKQATNDAAKKKDLTFSFGHGTLNPLRLPEISEILDTRAALIDKLAGGVASAQAAAEFAVPEDWFDELGESMLRRHKLLSNSFFVQARYGEQNDLSLVLNHVYSGFGCMYTRFHHLFPKEGPDSLYEALHANLKKLQVAGTLFAEFQGGHDTNLNQHNLLTDFEIVCPGERGTASLDRQIHISDLAIRYDAQTDELQLHCERLSQNVIPLFLGLLYPLALPELQTLLLLFSTPTVLRTEIAPRRLPAGDEVAYQPRIRYRSVVLERAKWTVNLSAIPKRQHNEGDYSYLLKLANWRLRSGIPREVFAKFVPPEFNPEDGQAPTVFYGSSHQKPFYVDFENPFCVSLLEKLATDHHGFVFLTEMLPSSQQAILQHERDAYASEFVLELTQRY